VSDPTGCDDNQYLPQQHKYNENNETTNQRSDHGVGLSSQVARQKAPSCPGPDADAVPTEVQSNMLQQASASAKDQSH
jgi:hypothetical protein